MHVSAWQDGHATALRNTVVYGSKQTGHGSASVTATDSVSAFSAADSLDLAFDLRGIFERRDTLSYTL